MTAMTRTADGFTETLDDFIEGRVTGPATADGPITVVLTGIPVDTAADFALFRRGCRRGTHLQVTADCFGRAVASFAAPLGGWLPGVRYAIGAGGLDYSWLWKYHFTGPR